ncbi:hypothetical protein [Euryhalocaulis sp.]
MGNQSVANGTDALASGV